MCSETTILGLCIQAKKLYLQGGNWLTWGVYITVQSVEMQRL